jgi:hypothetical protein
MFKPLAAGTGHSGSKAVARSLAGAAFDPLAGICQRTANRGRVGGASTLRKTRQTIWTSRMDCRDGEETRPRINASITRPPKKSGHNMRIMDLSPVFPPLFSFFPTDNQSSVIGCIENSQQCLTLCALLISESAPGALLPHCFVLRFTSPAPKQN